MHHIQFPVFMYIISYVDDLLIYVVVNVLGWLLLALMLCGTSVWNVMWQVIQLLIIVLLFLCSKSVEYGYLSILYTIL
jgi:hypothetical protein